MKILKFFTFIFCLALFACNGFSNKKTPLYKVPEVPQNILIPSVQNQFNSGVDFVANGSSIADWTLEMNFDDSIYFHAQNGLSFTIPSVRPLESTDQSLRFVSLIALGKVVISITKGNCNNVTNNVNETSRQCTVSIADITYSGCGQFLYNSELEGKWILQQYKGEKITEASFKNGLPYLDFNILKNSFTGFDGCNSLKGSAALLGKRIQFAAIATSRKICSAIPLPNLFSALSNELVDYKIAKGILTFYLKDDSVLVFKK